MRRWLTHVGVVAGLAVLAGAGVAAWPLLWPADPDDSARTVEGHRVSEATGYVISLDPEAGLLKISSSILGLRAVALAIDANTPITVGDKQGGLGDLAVDTPVRVAYELEGQTRRARSVELVVPESDTRVGSSDIFSAPASAASAPRPSTEPLPVVEPERAVQPAARVDVAPKRPPLTPVTTPRPATPPRKVVERTPAAVQARKPRVDEKVLPAAPAAPKAADETGPADGSAAIDWLLRSRGR